MPKYEYACKDCGEHLEVVQSFKDDPLTECPACEGTLRKVFGNIGIVFKGSGFYKTDSRSSKSSSAKAEKSPTDSSGKSGTDSAKSGKSGSDSPTTASTSKPEAKTA